MILVCLWSIHLLWLCLLFSLSLLVLLEVCGYVFCVLWFVPYGCRSLFVGFCCVPFFVCCVFMFKRFFIAVPLCGSQALCLESSRNFNISISPPSFGGGVYPSLDISQGVPNRWVGKKYSRRAPTWDFKIHWKWVFPVYDAAWVYKETQSEPKIMQSDPKAIPKWPQGYPKDDPKVTQKWSQNDPKMILKWYQVWPQSDPKVMPKWYQIWPTSDPKVMPKWYQIWPPSDPKVMPKWYQIWPQSNPKVMPKWYQSYPRVIPNWSQMSRNTCTCLYKYIYGHLFIDAHIYL